MNAQRPAETRPWMLFALPAAIVVPANDAERRHWRRAAMQRFLVPLAIAAVGIVLITTASQTVSIIGWGTFAVAITVAISLIFLEIGYSEERARAREARARRSPRHRRPRRSVG